MLHFVYNFQLAGVLSESLLSLLVCLCLHLVLCTFPGSLFSYHGFHFVGKGLTSIQIQLTTLMNTKLKIRSVIKMSIFNLKEESLYNCFLRCNIHKQPESFQTQHNMIKIYKIVTFYHNVNVTLSYFVGLFCLIKQFGK